MLSGFCGAENFKLDRMFFSYEANGEYYISSIGIGTTFKKSGSDIGFQLNTSLGSYNVISKEGEPKDYTSWDVSAKFGYFSRTSFYIEAGFDMAETLAIGLRSNDNGSCFDEQFCDNDNVDSFLGLGAGVELGELQLDGFFRYRNIDSPAWESKIDTFTGIQISIKF